MSPPSRSPARGRGYRLGRLGLQLVGSYLGYQVQNLVSPGKKEDRRGQLRRGAARRVRQELGEMKGAAMKLGQLFSLYGDTLPPEVVRELSELQMRAPGMHPTLVRAQIKAAFGRGPEELFRSFEAEPFAAASLGQVHRAVGPDGENLAVKVQYPAIRAAIENDLRCLRSAVLPARLAGHATAPMIEELQRGFLEETDYRREADNIDLFREGLAHLPYLTIPRVRRDLSNDRILAMSLVPGESLDAFLQGRPAAALRNKVGERIVEVYQTQIHRLKAIHADPHPGNYLFGPDGQIGLVDFGCVKRIDLAPLIGALARRAWKDGPAEEGRVLRLIFGPEIPLRRARRYLPALERAADFLYPPVGPGEVALVDYTNPVLGNALTDNARLALQHRLAAPEFVFTTRAELGIHHLLRRLEAKVDVSAFWRRLSPGVRSKPGARSPRG